MALLIIASNKKVRRRGVEPGTSVKHRADCYDSLYVYQLKIFFYWKNFVQYENSTKT